MQVLSLSRTEDQASWLYHWDPDTTHLHWDGHFEPKNLRVCLHFLVSISQMLLERVAQLQFVCCLGR